MEFAPLLIPAFIAGFLTFLAPCTLPLVPAYLSFISGVSTEELNNPQEREKAKRKVVLNGLGFVTGFSFVFIAFGALAGFVGTSLLPYKIWLSRIGGVFVIIFGLFMINVLKVPLLGRELHVKVPAIFKRGRPSTSFLVGSSFGFGWTPCVGPILGSILLIASTSSTAFQGAFLLAIFSAGLAVPFLFIALGIGKASQKTEKYLKYSGAISLIGGVFLIIIGALLVTNSISLLVSYGFRFLEFINYDAILDYL